MLIINTSMRRPDSRAVTGEASWRTLRLRRRAPPKACRQLPELRDDLGGTVGAANTLKDEVAALIRNDDLIQAHRSSRTAVDGVGFQFVGVGAVDSNHLARERGHARQQIRLFRSRFGKFSRVPDLTVPNGMAR